MIAHGFAIPAPGKKPVEGAAGISHGFLGGEGLGGHDKEGGLRIQLFERIDQMLSIDI